MMMVRNFNTEANPVYIKTPKGNESLRHIKPIINHPIQNDKSNQQVAKQVHLETFLALLKNDNPLLENIKDAISFQPPNTEGYIPINSVINAGHYAKYEFAPEEEMAAPDVLKTKRLYLRKRGNQILTVCKIHSLLDKVDKVDVQKLKELISPVEMEEYDSRKFPEHLQPFLEAEKSFVKQILGGATLEESIYMPIPIIEGKELRRMYYFVFSEKHLSREELDSLKEANERIFKKALDSIGRHNTDIPDGVPVSI